MTPANANGKFSDDEKAEIKAIMHEAITEYFAEKGALGQWILVTVAKIVVSVSVIGGGAYWLLTVAGFHRG